MEQRDPLIDALLHDDMRKLNSHLPKNRRTLKELLSDPAPRVLSASGDSIRMKKSELEELSRSLPVEAGKATSCAAEQERPRARSFHSNGRSVRGVCNDASRRILPRKFRTIQGTKI